MQAVCKNNMDKMEEIILEKGFDINSVVDKQGKYTALSLACHLDNLEMVHFLDLMGADLESARGKLKNTPLMTATMRWNVRIVDYLIERGVNPLVTDKFGFTASKKAEIKNLKTIYSMLSQYEKTFTISRAHELAITNKKWSDIIKQNNLNIFKY
jgi:ankyrin repeat protein